LLTENQERRLPGHRRPAVRFLTREEMRSFMHIVGSDAMWAVEDSSGRRRAWLHMPVGEPPRTGEVLHECAGVVIDGTAFWNTWNPSLCIVVSVWGYSIGANSMTIC
jgi:hypothetical protein